MLANHPSDPNNQPKHMLNIKNYLQSTRKDTQPKKAQFKEKTKKLGKLTGHIFHLSHSDCTDVNI
jgi:hypothetical protein